MSADKVIRWLHKHDRYSDIAETIGCCESTLYLIRKHLGINEPQTRIEYTPTYPGGTKFLKEFLNIEDAVVECRDKLALSVEDTARELGVSRSTICRYTPEYLKYTYNKSR